MLRETRVAPRSDDGRGLGRGNADAVPVPGPDVDADEMDADVHRVDLDRQRVPHPLAFAHDGAFDRDFERPYRKRERGNRLDTSGRTPVTVRRGLLREGADEVQKSSGRGRREGH